MKRPLIPNLSQRVPWPASMSKCTSAYSQCCQAQGALSIADIDAIVTPINDLARGCLAGIDAAHRLQTLASKGAELATSRLK